MRRPASRVRAAFDNAAAEARRFTSIGRPYQSGRFFSWCTTSDPIEFPPSTAIEVPVT